MKNQEQTNEGSRRDPESIRKEYKELKKASISYLRTEWSRSFRVGDPKGTDKTGLISDILRARHGNKHVTLPLNQRSPKSDVLVYQVQCQVLFIL